jgi:hypothetical protein
MTDWNTVCTNFSNTFQDSDKSFPGSCTRDTAKSVKDTIVLAQRINNLKGKIDRESTSYSASDDDKNMLKQSMKDFCCAMYTRKELENTYREAQQDYSVAKQRVDSVRNPPAQVSAYGTTIPFGRPLRSDSVPILLGTTLLFIILALGILLNLGNVQLAYVGPRSYGPGVFQQLIDSYRQTSWSVLLITVAASAGVAIGIYYAVQNK